MRRTSINHSSFRVKCFPLSSLSSTNSDNMRASHMAFTLAFVVESHHSPDYHGYTKLRGVYSTVEAGLWALHDGGSAQLQSAFNPVVWSLKAWPVDEKIEDTDKYTRAKPVASWTWDAQAMRIMSKTDHWRVMWPLATAIVDDVVATETDKATALADSTTVRCLAETIAERDKRFDDSTVKRFLLDLSIPVDDKLASVALVRKSVVQVSSLMQRYVVRANTSHCPL